ncbi:lipopolysaccharide biosynthesis protein [Peribacillus sp. NPDC096379]|uniref:lipopolysaccharide biosynthesis protein n=1 Tax=Peribacillus sp. NPDC096379 TaxID=3364393 RepID=UPI0037F335BC
MDKERSRIKNTIRNTTYGISGQILTYVFTFMYRTVFINTLGVTYLGINGVFTNLLSILSLAELGIGAAITFSLYKPLAEGNKNQIKALMTFYANTYKVIALLITILGISIAPFIEYFIKEESIIPSLTLIYFLILADSAVSYFFAYKRSLIIADQRGYINTINVNSFAIIRNLLQIAVLLITKEFIYTLVIQIVCTLASNISISLKVNKLYPYLKSGSKVKLGKDYKTDLFKKLRAMSYHNIGSVVVLGTDNLLISSLVGVYWVGLYSNYLMIMAIIRNIIGQFYNSIIASIGNLTASDDVDKSYNIFKKLFFLNYWIYSFVSICLLTLYNPFISLWIGEKYILDQLIVIVIVINFYLSGMRQNVLAYRNALGLYWNDRYKPIAEATINLVASLVLIKQFGLIGVFLGTTISLITTSFWVEPYILFKHYFKKRVRFYFAKYIVRFIFTLIMATLMQLLSNTIYQNTWGSFILLTILCITIFNFIFLLVYIRSGELKYLFFIFKKFVINPLYLKRKARK